MSLKSLAAKKGILIGVAVAINPLRNDSRYSNLIVKEFNLITPENAMKWGAIRKNKGYDFTDGDFIVSFAKKNRLQIHGHTLIWHKSLPSWLSQENFSKDEIRKIFKDHILTVVKHFRGSIVAWDVINEALEDTEEGEIDYNTFWYKNLGPEYVELAFKYAHEADPDADLFYNEWGAEDLGKKSNIMYDLVKNLVNKKIPITGVGLQMHTGLEFSPSPKEVVKNIQRYKDLGLKVYITEMDVRIEYGKGSLENKLKEQAKIYGEIIEAIANQNLTDAIVFWGLDDKHSWIPYFFDKNDAPLLFDRNLKPKPAYFAVAKALK